MPYKFVFVCLFDCFPSAHCCLINMSLKNEVLLVWVICLSCKVVLTGCEVVLVNRDHRDSFHVGKNGCTYDSSICTNSHATCIRPGGLCLCGIRKPNYRNPHGTRPGDDKGRGCLSSDNMRGDLFGGSDHCALGPFRLISYNQNETARKFSDIDNPNLVMKSCSLRNVLVKFPDKAVEMELQWLDESDVDLNVSNNDLYFKWKRAVPNLQGTIITFNLYCKVQIQGVTADQSNQRKCLRAKIHGTWFADHVPTEPTEVSTSSEPTETSTPTEPTKVSVLTRPTEVSTQTEPTKVSIPYETTKISTPSEPTEVSTPTESSKIFTPTEPKEVSVPTEPEYISTPTEAIVTSSQPKSSQIITKSTSSVTVTTAEPRTNLIGSTPVVTKAPTTSVLTSTGTMTMSRTTSARSSSPGEGSSSDGVFSGAIIAIAVMVAAVLLISLVVLVWLLCKRKKRNGPRNSSRGIPCRENGSTSMKQFRYTESNSRTPDAYGDTRDTNETLAVYSNPLYTTINVHSEVVEGDPVYETPHSQNVMVEANDPDYATPKNDPAYTTPNSDPAYATPNSDPAYATTNNYSAYATTTNDSAYATPNSDPAYATPNSDHDYATTNNNPAYATPNNPSVVIEANDSAYATPSNDPAYATTNNDPAYAMPNNNPVYATPDNQRMLVEANNRQANTYTRPDSQCVVVEEHQIASV